jgi:cold-inducible RNA-binding protein
MKDFKMNTKLYVGNLSYGTSEDSLRELFAKTGTVQSIDMIKDRYTGEMKGFAFVTMSTQEEAENAIKNLNGTVVDNRQLKVNLARPREERPRKSYGNRRW